MCKQRQPHGENRYGLSSRENQGTPTIQWATESAQKPRIKVQGTEVPGLSEVARASFKLQPLRFQEEFVLSDSTCGKRHCELGLFCYYTCSG